MLYCSHVWMTPGKISCELTGSPSLNEVFELNWIEKTYVCWSFIYNYVFLLVYDAVQWTRLEHSCARFWYVIDQNMYSICFYSTSTRPDNRYMHWRGQAYEVWIHCLWTLFAGNGYPRNRNGLYVSNSYNMDIYHTLINDRTHSVLELHSIISLLTLI